MAGTSPGTIWGWITDGLDRFAGKAFVTSLVVVGLIVFMWKYYFDVSEAAVVLTNDGNTAIGIVLAGWLVDYTANWHDAHQANVTVAAIISLAAVACFMIAHKLVETWASKKYPTP